MRQPWSVPIPDPGRAPEAWDELTALAATILGEAEGETRVGKLAVAYCIMNRVEDTRWPSNARDVCLQRLQFSCWNTGSPRINAMLKPQDHVPEAIWRDCFLAATEAMFHLEADPTKGANHYLAPGSLSTLPSWALAERRVAIIGDHHFYRL